VRFFGGGGEGAEAGWAVEGHPECAVSRSDGLACGYGTTRGLGLDAQSKVAPSNSQSRLL
jgi:hypothetical protein